MAACFHKEYGGELVKLLSHRVRLDVNGETHKLTTTFFSSILNHSILPEERLRQLMSWAEQGMAVGFVIDSSYSL